VHVLEERVKELTLLHATARIAENAERDTADMLTEIVSMIPGGWEYPDMVAARIVFDGTQYASANFSLTPWRQRADFVLGNERRGFIEVVYLEEKSASAGDLFLPEERELITSLAEIVGTSLDRKQIMETLHALNVTLEERVKARTADVMAKQQQLRALAIELSRTETRERKRLAVDLHDNLAQLLALGLMKLRSIPTESSMSLREVQEVLNKALTYTRTLMSDLRPPLLGGDDDLSRAIGWVADRMRRHGLIITIEDDQQRKVLDEEVLTVTYQSIQELLLNVLKHAHTTSVKITFRRCGEFLEAWVMDRGLGFDVSASQRPSTEEVFGLLNIRERVELLGGRFEISSVSGEGTSAMLIVPLHLDFLKGEQIAPAGGMAGRTCGSTGVSRKIAILLVDDHRMVREGLRSIIEGHGDLEVLGEASDGCMAVEMARALRPDVVLMDVNMPRMNGVEATRLITAEFPEIRIIGLSMHEDEKIARDMQEAGASDYLSKGGAFDTLYEAIRGGRKILKR
jgi:signal transduction histidine kinase/CheY-like chemotaxis protein